MQFDLKKATVKIKDNGANNLVLKVHEGTLSFTEKVNRTYVKDRGKLGTVRDGDEEPMDVRFDLIWDFLTASAGSGTPTPRDALTKTGEAAAWVSSSSDACEPYCVDIEITFAPGCSPTLGETITLPDFRHESIAMDAKQGQLSVTGKCNAVKATAVRA